MVNALDRPDVMVMACSDAIPRAKRDLICSKRRIGADFASLGFAM